MLQLVALIVALGVLANAQAPCCFPAQYEGGMSDLVARYEPSTGTASAFRRFSLFSMDNSDPDNMVYRRNRLVVNMYNGERMTRSYIVKNNLEYRFNETSCTTSAARPRPFRGCITDAAQFRGSIYVGLGEHSLKLHVWRFSLGNVTVSSQVTENCVPVAFNAAGRDGDVDFARSSMLLGFTAGISNRNVFDVPSYCPAAP